MQKITIFFNKRRSESFYNIIADVVGGNLCSDLKIGILLIHEERIMKKIITLFAGLLLMISSAVFAEEHAKAALEHANAAVEQGKAGNAKGIVEHASVALEHALAGALVAHGGPKGHLEAGANELEEAINHGNLGHAEDATKHAESAVVHIKAGQ